MIVFLLSLPKESRLYITMHVVQFLIYAVIDPSHKNFWSKSIMQFKSLRGSWSPKALSTTTYIHHTHRNHGRHKSIYSLHNSKARLPHSLSYENLATHTLDKTIHKINRRHWITDIGEKKKIWSQYNWWKILQHFVFKLLSLLWKIFSKVLK